MTFGPVGTAGRLCRAGRHAPKIDVMTRYRDLRPIEHLPPAGAARAADATLDELRREILRRVTPVLAGAGLAAGRATCRLEPSSTLLDVRFELPIAVPATTKQAMAVRVLDAVRGAGQTFGPVRVSVLDGTSGAG